MIYIIFTTLESTLLLAFVLYLVYEYSARDVPFHIKALSFVSWIASFSVVVILPIDIYFSVLTTDTDEKNSGSKILYVLWSIIYWMNFLFTWVVLPMFQEYEDAGEFTIREKMKRSIKNNLIIYGIGAVFFLVFILYLAFTKKLGEQGLSAFLIAMANCFGIFLIIMLLGYGLVSIPRNWWREGNQELTLKYYQFQAALLEDSKHDAEFDLEESIKLAFVLNDSCTQSKPHLVQYTKTILDSIPKDLLTSAKGTLNTNVCRDIEKEFGEVTIEKLIALNRQMKKGLCEHHRALARWESLLEKAFLMEDILESRQAQDRKIRSTFWVEKTGILNEAYEVLLWVWHVKVKRVVCRVVSVFFAAFSVIVVISQITLFVNLDLSVFGNLIKVCQGFIETEIFTLIPLLYISFAVFVGLFNLKLAGFFGLYKHHQTDGPSLMFSSLNFSRVSAPMCLNFLQIIKIQNTNFNSVMGEVDLVPIFGTSFTLFFPIILVVLCLLNLTNIHSKLLTCLGLKQFQFTESFNDERIEEGKKSLQKARTAREKQFQAIKNGQIKTFHGYTADNSVLSQMKLRDDIDLEENGADFKFRGWGAGDLKRSQKMNKQASTDKMNVN